MLSSDLWDSREGGYQKSLEITKKAELVDYICQHVLSVVELKLSNGAIFPDFTFNQISHKHLVNHGFVFDEEGQAHLPDTSFAGTADI